MIPPAAVPLRAGSVLRRAEIPEVPFAGFREAVCAAVGGGLRLAALFAERSGERGFRLHAVLADDSDRSLGLLATVVRDAYDALTPDCPQAHRFEREILEQTGVLPAGHPRLRPVREIGGPGSRPREPFFAVAGETIHEVAVGPVHAGVIEPGHFRFQCRGEEVLHLEIALGYQHRGVERAFVGGPGRRSVHHAETLAGDTSIGHATAHAEIVEGLSGAEAPDRGVAIRGVALELERLANHTGDLGALAGDVGFLPVAADCGRLRGDFLNATALLCGSRFGRGLVRSGGVGFDLDPVRVEELSRRIASAVREVEGAAAMLGRTPSVRARFEDVGGVSTTDAIALGLVGPAARASGLSRDARADHPSGAWLGSPIPAATATTGDVRGRVEVRVAEIGHAARWIGERLAALPAGPVRVETGPLAADGIAVSLVEGWRGEIVHVALTDGEGRFSRYKVVDPSFRNWAALEIAMRGEAISDFPLCNKSFNLSYCGHDL